MNWCGVCRKPTSSETVELPEQSSPTPRSLRPEGYEGLTNSVHLSEAHAGLRPAVAMISEDARPHEDADHEESQYTEWLSSERRICQRMEWMEHLPKQGRTEEFVLDPGLWT